MRQSMSVQEWREKSDRICTHLQSLPLFTQADTILAYFSFRQEPDLSPLFSHKKHRFGFPRCVEKSMRWHSWEPGEALGTGLYGILEPQSNAPAIRAEEVDLLLIPAVASDRRGYRLGYGGGYYDRLLSLPEWAEKPAIAIVFEFAYLPELPTDNWDRVLQGVCTETGYSQFK